MTSKTCFKCKIEKPLYDYYKHPYMGDGHLNKCKECTKIDTKIITEKKTSTPEGLEKERERHREKYKRLGYKEKQKEWDLKSNRFWKNSPTYKGLHKKFKTPKGFELHHWNYNNEYLEDIFVLNTKQHRIAHSFLTFDKNLLVFKTKEGVLLDTKSKHLSYLLSCNIQM